MARKNSHEVFSVTSAPENPAADRDERSRRYLIAMSIRVICFLLIWVVHGWMRLVMVIAMVALPYVAVVIANAGRESRREPGPRAVPPPQTPGIEGRKDALGPGTT